MEYRLDYLKLWGKFYNQNPNMLWVTKWKTRLCAFIKQYFDFVLNTDEGGLNGWVGVFNKLPDFETLRRSDQEYRKKNSQLFPESSKRTWRNQATLWKKPDDRKARFEG